MNKLLKKKKGFALVEMIAIVAIVSILTSVSVPIVRQYASRSKKTAVLLQVRNFVSSLEIYNATSRDPIVDGDVLRAAQKIFDYDPDLIGNNEDKSKAILNFIGKIQNMDINTAKDIDSDSKAVKKIIINKSGDFENYDESNILEK